MIRLRHAAVGVKDLERALGFYRQVLGFEPYYTPSKDWAMVARGGTSISLVPAHGTHPGHLGVTLDSREEVDRMRERLLASEARQVSDCKTHRDGAYGFYFKDPEGNQLECIFIPHLAHPGRPGESIVLLAHGSADPDWAAPVRALAERIRRNAEGVEVRLAFLEGQRPGLDQAVSDLIQETSPRRVRIVPVFLSSGGAHLKRDVPALVDQVRAEHPGVRVELDKPLVEHEDVLDAMAVAALAPLLGS